MLPYVHVADLELLGIHLHPFGLLVVTAIWVGTALARWQARRRGVDLAELESFIRWMLLFGFVSAHVLDMILYRPREVLARPWALLMIWEGIGSFSGFIGALVGVVLWRRFTWRTVRSFGPWRLGPITLGPFTLSTLARRPAVLPILPFADLILSVFPVAWIFGRAGCSIAHDHPGAQAEGGALLAVAFPSSNPAAIDGPGAHGTLGPITIIHGHHPRYDLGTLELFVTIAIALVCVALWRRRTIPGLYVVLVSLAYAPARFALDFLRIRGAHGDARYVGLTPAQWLCIALFFVALGVLRHVVVLRRSSAKTMCVAVGPHDAS
jgi:phosphatidylglycerol:prolipoprotein diacylglycerol transferase